MIEAIVSESNREQDKALANRMRSLHQRGSADYAVNFGRFLQAKTEIERAIHSDGEVLTGAKEQVEKLVDSLCFGVAEEFDRLIQLDEKPQNSQGAEKSTQSERQELVERIQRAYRTLSETQNNLPVILNPAGKPGARESRLDDVIDRLKEEADIARRVKERLEGGSDVGSTSTTQGSTGAAVELE